MSKHTHYFQRKTILRDKTGIKIFQIKMFLWSRFALLTYVVWYKKEISGKSVSFSPRKLQHVSTHFKENLWLSVTYFVVEIVTFIFTHTTVRCHFKASTYSGWTILNFKNWNATRSAISHCNHARFEERVYLLQSFRNCLLRFHGFKTRDNLFWCRLGTLSLMRDSIYYEFRCYRVTPIKVFGEINTPDGNLTSNLPCGKREIGRKKCIVLGHFRFVAIESTVDFYWWNLSELIINLIDLSKLNK